MMLPLIAAVAALLVPIGEGRQLSLSCRGSGSPIVLFESGLGVYSGTWLEVQKRVAKTTRACVYDRLGLGASSPAPAGRTSADHVRDLEALIGAAHLSPPYVLVGASFGGLDAQLFAFTHPDAVAGLVLVDSLHPDFDRRIEQLLPARVARQRRAELGLNRERIAFAQITASEREVALARVPLRLRLTVIRHGLPFSTAAGWPTAKVERLWLALQTDLTRLTDPPGRLVPAARSGHRVAEQQPALVAAEIVRVVTAAR